MASAIPAMATDLLNRRGHQVGLQQKPIKGNARALVKFKSVKFNGRVDLDLKIPAIENNARGLLVNPRPKGFDYVA